MKDKKKIPLLFSLKKLAGLLHPFRLVLVVCVMAMIVSIAFTIVTPLIFAKVIDLILDGSLRSIMNTGGIDFVMLKNLLLLCALLYIVSAVVSSIQAWLLTGIANKIGQNLRNQINEKLNRLPMSYFDEHSHGDTLALIINDVNAITTGLNQGVPQLFVGTLTIIGVLIIMLMTDWMMTLVTLAILPLSAFLLPLIITRSQANFRRLQEDIGQTSGVTNEVLSGHFIVKSCNREEKTIEDFERMNQKLHRTARSSLFYSGLIMPFMLFAMNCGYILLCVVGGFCTVLGRITVGEIQAFMQYSMLLTQPLGQIAGLAGVIQQMFASVERIAVLMESPEEIPDNNRLPTILVTEGEVRFENVRFGYVPEQTVIHHFSLTVKQGQKVAIVGPTGAGKTTLVKLLMRFYDVNGGKIMVDGYDIRDYPRTTLRNRFGMVLQETWLYNDTVRDNIRYGCDAATDDDIISAAKNAYADNFIRTWPNGYDLILSEGANNISQGQKQLLTIARALLPNPKILILDEATSAVDTHTEVLIQRAMNNLMRGRTCFIIAHRLSTIRDADVILVMRNGDIIETGNHKELLAKNGFYTDLYNSQFDIERDDTIVQAE
ncbi:MAG: ABC transporter ATP-binding protein/permease [Planctomycetaceae bacterium]|nr:ABC transporter ATP-binding protein/permease [Planctomycetaceae bacterium]